MPLARRSLLAAALAAPVPRLARAARRSLTIAGPAGLFQPAYDTAVIDPFRRRNPGLDITYYPAAASDQIVDALHSHRVIPPIDVALLEIIAAATATDQKLLVSLGPASLPGLALPAAAFTKGVAGPAVMLDCLAIAYSPQQVRPAPTTWRVLWERNLRGQIILPPAPDSAGIAFTLVANAVFGGDDYRESLETGINAIRLLAPGVETWYPIPDIYRAIMGGDGAIGVAWNAEGQMIARNAGGKLGMAIPVEGSIFQVMTINLTAASANPEAARDFIAYALSTDAQQAIAEHLFYTPANSGVKLDQAALARTASSPAQLARMMEVNWLDVAMMRDRITRDWRHRIMTER
ncbi:MAG TPA: extracellular solute-binding protein [Acetobacteraceae bacterium]|jgi:putative spermidine/putrescine transport system substrate-binding protein